MTVKPVSRKPDFRALENIQFYHKIYLQKKLLENCLNLLNTLSKQKFTYQLIVIFQG